MKSFKTKIVIFFFIILLVVCRTLGITSYVQLSGVLINSVERNLEKIAKESSKVIKVRIDVQLENSKYNKGEVYEKGIVNS
ncbi:MAG: hypothetical protein N4A57_01660 [Anaeromicrobium sp.]|jgi:hypothetical protein|uniref:hypothetical protein n=1 Tax=Anaeromicrobium sp. TaxID=1929132 RepID=UPI0025FA321C|nr:hypothetical protein [Anaeromicrobium sp.]MCT4592972.1 hypothetical protein [Anaeromicrobium sp.]